LTGIGKGRPEALEARHQFSWAIEVFAEPAGLKIHQQENSNMEEKTQ